MKTLLVDNHTNHIEKWKDLLSKYPTTIEFVRAEDIDLQKTDEYDIIILSGGTQFAIDRNLDSFQKEFELIRTREKPLLGVCLGFEAMIVALGGELLYRTDRVSGIEHNKVVFKHPIFGNMESFNSQVAHKYYCATVPENCKTLAISDHGIEVFCHNSKPLFGFQFHPESIEPKNDGQKIFENFMNHICGVKKSS
jgi:anthranilate/para-aminobenzoate synthase component II